ncbi:MAG TPA: hypothetical protein VFJ10_13845, partial [Acidobacteriaceae bacterium]|nr:hypothetical protein [Acidobacteriaceae bacterium]
MSTAAALRAVHATEGGWFHVSAFAALLRCTEAEALTALDLGVAAGYLQKFVPIPGKTPPIYRETTRGDWV